jgi:heme/copper-type cytochrome/quinol oxidase subunit 2
MTASSRFGYSMFTGALLSGALVGWEAAKRPAQITAGAAAHHVSQGSMRLTTFIALALVLGVITFVVATAAGARGRRAQRRSGQGGQQQRRRPARQRGYGGAR